MSEQWTDERIDADVRRLRQLYMEHFGVTDDDGNGSAWTDDLIAAVVARAKREERERIATEVRQRATEIWPVDVFPCMDTPDWEVINATIRQAGYTPDRISAHVMRHAFDVAAEEIEATDD